MCGGDGNRVAAAQVVIFAIRTAAVAGQTADASADADEVCVRRQGHRADVAAALHGHGFVADADIAGDAGTPNRAGSQPACIFQIIRRRLTGCAVELIHAPVVADIPVTLKLLDDFADGELPGDARPHVAVLVTGIYDHVRVSVPQHPADGVHGAAAVNIAGIARLDRVTVQIDDLKRACGVILCAGAVHGMLQTVNRLPFQIVRCGIDRAIAVEFGNLLVLAVMPGTALKPLLTGIEGLDAGVVVPQIEIRGRIRGNRLKRIGIVGDGQLMRIGGRQIVHRDKERVGVRPDQLAVCVVRAVQIAHLAPVAPRRVLLNGFHRNNSIAGEYALPIVAVIIFRHGFVDGKINAGFGGDGGVIPGLQQRCLRFGRRRCFRGFFAYGQLAKENECIHIADVGGDEAAGTLFFEHLSGFFGNRNAGYIQFGDIAGKGFVCIGNPPDLERRFGFFGDKQNAAVLFQGEQRRGQGGIFVYDGFCVSSGIRIAVFQNRFGYGKRFLVVGKRAFFGDGRFFGRNFFSRRFVRRVCIRHFFRDFGRRGFLDIRIGRFGRFRFILIGDIGSILVSGDFRDFRLLAGFHRFIGFF